MATRVCAIMAGGSGERFWPLSRPGRPKQLLRLTHPDRSMLEEAVGRVEPLFPHRRVYVAASPSLRQPIVDSRVVNEENVLTEPTRRNTLGAQCWIVANMLASGLDEATLAILTADHRIGDDQNFSDSVNACMEIAEQTGAIVTLGIVPTRPETGFGYIEEDLTSAVLTVGARTANRAKSFREKPSEETAEKFLEAGTFLWNSGMFFFTVASFLRELEKAQPAAHRITLDMASALRTGNTTDAAAAFEQLPNISIDYAVMERAENLCVLRADFPWDDVGTWDAMERSREADPSGNVVEGEVLVVDCHDCIALSLHPKLSVGVLGLRDMVVVAGEDAVLVCHKRDAQRVRLLAQMEIQRARER